MKAFLLWALMGVVNFSSTNGEPDYFLRTPSPTSVVVHQGKPISAPSSRAHQFRSRPQILRYVNSEAEALFGNPAPPPPPPPPPRFRFHENTSKKLSPHPNSIPREEKHPFEVVPAPVIYHHTVTDTDVTKALADAFNVVGGLRKPSKSPGESVKTTVEYVNHPSYPLQDPKATLTTTVVEAPQQVELVHPVRTSSGDAFYPGNFHFTSIVGQPLPPVPSAADVPPPPRVVQLVHHAPVSYVTSAPILEEAVPVAPATSTSTAPASFAQGAPLPKLIIPSQPHVTTLAEAVHVGDSKVRTIIQPVYIPYPVDQHGRPLGPLPDYHSMDFSAILSAQKQLLASPSPIPVPSSVAPTTVQIVDTEPVHLQPSPSEETRHLAQQQQQLFYVQDQSVAAAGNVDSSPATPEVSTSPVPTQPTSSRRTIRRRLRNGQKSAAQRN